MMLLKSISFRVDGIRNNTDKQQLRNLLDKVEGVQEVAIDPASSMIDVEYNAPATEQEIWKSLESSGHDIKKE